ncbi:MAG: hypothetical protein ACREHD_14285 [Pirellulales bacterium]
MTRVTVDPELRKKLLDLREPLYLCDESGHIVGEFTPLDTRVPPDYVEPPLSEEEWKRRELEPGYTTDEVLARLRRQ